MEIELCIVASSVRDSQFLDMFAALGLVQMSQVPTYFPSGNVLDLIHYSHEERVGTWEVLSPLPCCSHDIVVYTYLFQNNVNDTE